MYSRAFIQGIKQKLEPIAPIVLPGIIKRQFNEVGATEDTITPELAEQFINRMVYALDSFLGPEGTRMVRQIMMKELRICAPEYFEEHALI